MSVESLRGMIYRQDGRIRGSFVYMLLCQDDGSIYAKVGLSDSPLTRLQSLRNGCPVTPRRFAFMAVPSRRRAQLAERRLHRALARWRVHGEWFKLELADKAQFNAAWRVALREATPSGWPLEWTQVSVTGLVKVWAQRRRFAQTLWKRRGKAYQDFVACGGRRVVVY